MVSTSNEGIMTEYLVNYGAMLGADKHRADRLLETLYIVDCYRAGRDLKIARRDYDRAMWDGTSSADIARRLEDLADFMGALARDRLTMYEVKH